MKPVAPVIAIRLLILLSCSGNGARHDNELMTVASRLLASPRQSQEVLVVVRGRLAHSASNSAKKVRSGARDSLDGLELLRRAALEDFLEVPVQAHDALAIYMAERSPSF